MKEKVIDLVLLFVLLYCAFVLEAYLISVSCAIVLIVPKLLKPRIDSVKPDDQIDKSGRSK